MNRYIFQAVDETNRWIETNTNLGIMMMCIPIAAAASISDSFDEIQENVGRLMDATTVEDAVNLYDAINVADAGGMGDQDEFDVMSEKAKDELRANNQTMFDVLKQELYECGWRVSVAQRPHVVRLVLMPHVKKEHIDMFLKDLKELLKE